MRLLLSAAFLIVGSSVPLFACAEVTVKCTTADDGHTVNILATNTENKSRQCSAVCPTKDSNGYSGSTSGTATVPAKAKDVNILSESDSTTTRIITGKGSISCQ